MIYQRRHPLIEAVQAILGQDFPKGVGLCVGGELAIRTSDYTHGNPNYGDYIIYPPTERDEEGELNYPEVWRKEEFEREFLVVADGWAPNGS